MNSFFEVYYIIAIGIMVPCFLSRTYSPIPQYPPWLTIFMALIWGILDAILWPITLIRLFL